MTSTTGVLVFIFKSIRMLPKPIKMFFSSLNSVALWHVVESELDLCSVTYSSLFNVKVKVHLLARPGQARPSRSREEGGL